MSSFYADKIASQVKPKYMDVKVCLDGELTSKRQFFFERMERGGAAAETAFGNPIEDQLKKVNEQIEAASLTVRIHAVPANRWIEATIANPMHEDPEKRFPGDTEQGCSVVGLTLDLLPESARIVDGDNLQPLTTAEWEDIGNKIDFGEYAQLINGIVNVNITNALINRFQAVDEDTAGKA